MAKTQVKKPKPPTKNTAAKKRPPKKITKKVGKSVALNPEVVESSALVPSAASDPVARYLSEIRKYPLLTKEEEFSLAAKYRETGDREAAQKLVTSNLRFVVKIAMEYSKFGAKMIDLIQEGNVGLMQAVQEFNPHKGVRLITYAVWWIRGHIQEFLMRHYSMVRIGTTHNQRKLFYELQRSRAQLERMGMESGLMQISGRLGIDEDQVKEMGSRVFQRDVSFDKPASPDDKTTLLDITANAVAPDAEDKNIDKIRPDLNDREKYVLEHRLLTDEPMTLQEIGDQYGITREAARQMEARLIDKIKKQMAAKN
jgi:RNA polymerase sigma-32 factor